MEENRTDMNNMAELGTEDVKGSLDAKDIGIIVGIMAAGAGAYAGGKKVYHLVKEKAVPAVKRKFNKDKNSEIKMVPEHEGSRRKSKKDVKAKESETDKDTE